MVLDDLQEQLKTLEPLIKTVTTFWENSSIETTLLELQKKTEDITVWQDPKQAYILKDLQALKNQKESYETLKKQFIDYKELLELFKNDESELTALVPEIRQFTKTLKNFKIQLLLHEPDDQSNCFLSINAGAGGTEAQDWAEIISRMYIRFCERENLQASVIDLQYGEEAGVKGITLFIKGKNAYGLLRSEHGSHRLVRISPFDANKKRHTSFAGVHVTPEVISSEIVIDDKDLRIDTYRAGGAGGQHVNKTDSAVRITHLPTNIVTQCQNERSQLQNKERAMAMLKAKLIQKQKEEQQAKTASFEKKKIDFGSQIRSYVLHPYKMVKDHRTEFESQQPDLVLDGDLIDFIEEYLVA